MQLEFVGYPVYWPWDFLTKGKGVDRDQPIERDGGGGGVASHMVSTPTTHRSIRRSSPNIVIGVDTMTTLTTPLALISFNKFPIGLT